MSCQSHLGMRPGGNGASSVEPGGGGDLSHGGRTHLPPPSAPAAPPILRSLLRSIRPCSERSSACLEKRVLGGHTLAATSAPPETARPPLPRASMSTACLRRRLEPQSCTYSPTGRRRSSLNLHDLGPGPTSKGTCPGKCGSDNHCSCELRKVE